MRNIITCFRPILFIALLLIGVQTSVAQSTKVVRGSVVDEMNDPIMGVTIKVPNSSVGTVTDLDGNFVLQVDKATEELQVSYIGYVTQLVKTSPSPIRVVMKEDTQMLEGIVVIGYGTQRKSDLTGSISNVTSEDLNGGLVSSPEQWITGKVW